MKYLEKVTYWTKGSLDKFGNPTWNGPTTTNCRWEEVSELFVTTDGKTESSRARVYLDPKLNIGDYVYRGKSNESSPIDAGADEIKQYFEVRNVNGTKRERKVIL